jgi:hypothetical protein
LNATAATWFPGIHEMLCGQAGARHLGHARSSPAVRLMAGILRAAQVHDRMNVILQPIPEGDAPLSAKVPGMGTTMARSRKV